MEEDIEKQDKMKSSIKVVMSVLQGFRRMAAHLDTLFQKLSGVRQNVS